MLVEVLHIVAYSLLDNAEVVIFKLLTLYRCRTEKCSACEDKVFSLIVCLLVNKEVFLLGTDCSNNALCCGVAEKS